VDPASCFFSDSSTPVPHCTGLGVVPECTNNNHRKIISYRNIPAPENSDFVAEFGDACSGHGTHVAGSALGGLAGPHDALPTSAFGGMARHAKLVFDDLPISPEDKFHVPDDLNAELLPHAYAAGARTYSMSWGNPTNTYGTMEIAIDTFMYMQPDFLIFKAAGNEGPDPLTLSDLSKNAVIVGASGQSLAGLAEDGSVGQPHLQITGGPEGSENLNFVSQMAAFGPAVVAGGDVWSGPLERVVPADACLGLLLDLHQKIALVSLGEGPGTFDIAL